jgi:hypothetical protein
VTPRNVFFLIPKKNQEDSYWPRLYAGSAKQSFVKTDFSRWRDEDDEDEEVAPNLPDFSQFGGNMPNMDFSNFAAGGEGDSDDEEDG